MAGIFGLGTRRQGFGEGRSETRTIGGRRKWPGFLVWELENRVLVRDEVKPGLPGLALGPLPVVLPRMVAVGNDRPDATFLQIFSPQQSFFGMAGDTVEEGAHHL
jgi:hypothetical protein